MKGFKLIIGIFMISFTCYAQESLPVKVFYDNFNVELHQTDTISTEPFKGFQVSFPYSKKLEEYDLLKITLFVDEFDPGTCDLKQKVEAISYGEPCIVSLEMINKKIFFAKYVKDSLVKIKFFEPNKKYNPFLKGYYDNFHVVVEGAFKSGEVEKKSYYTDGRVYSSKMVNQYDGYTKLGESAVFQNGIQSHIVLFGKIKKKHKPCAIEYYKNLKDRLAKEKENLK